MSARLGHDRRLPSRRLVMVAALVCLSCLMRTATADEREPSRRSTHRDSPGPSVSGPGLAPATAASGLAPTPRMDPAGSLHFELPLANLVEDRRPVTLHGLSNDFHFALPLPALMQPSSVALTLHGVASHALVDPSQLAVSVNGLTVGQFALSSGDDTFVHRINLPLAQLRAGFNDVRIQVAHHSAKTCETAFAPELWTQIDMVSSTFSMDATPKAVPVTLDHLNDIFDKTDWQPQLVVPIFTVGAPNEGVLTALGKVAHGVGLRFDYLPVSIAQRRISASWSDVAAAMSATSRVGVIVGTFDRLAPLMSDLGVPIDEGPVIALRSLPGDASRLLVFVAAADESDLAKVATVFSMQQIPWPSRPWVAISQLKLPNPDEFSGRIASAVADSGAFPLRALNFHTVTLTGIDAPPATLRVWSGSWQGRMQLRFHLSYPTGMASQSALNVLANGILQSSIPLNDPAGGGYDNYAVSVPAGAVQSGWNTIQFQPVLIPISNGGECRPFFVGNLGLTIYEDTTLQKFGGNALRKPDLALFAGTGSPYTDAPLGGNLAIALADDDEATVSSGLTLMSKLSQVFRGPLINATFELGARTVRANQIWIGPYANLPPQIRESASSALPRQFVSEVPIEESDTVASLELGWLLNIRDRLGTTGINGHQVLHADVGLGGGFAKSAFAVNTVKDHGVLTVFTADNAPLLAAAMSTLVGYGPWSQLRGSAAFWSPESDRVMAVSSEDAPFAAYGIRGGLSIWISQYPWLSLIAVSVLIVVLVFLTSLALRLYRRKQH